MPIDIIIDEQATRRPNAGGQAEFVNDWIHLYVGLEGGWFSGKTFAGAGKLVSIHIFNAFNADGDATFIPSVVVGPTYSNAMDYDVPALQDALEEAGLTTRWKGSGGIAEGRFSAPAIILPDLGSRKHPSLILVRTADAPQRITGWTVGAAWGDEPTRWPEDRSDPKNDPFIQLSGRVRHPQARFRQLMFTYTNEGDATRAFEDFHAGKVTHALYRARTRENPAAKEFEAEQRANLPPELADQYLDGEAINLRGARIYPRFNRQVNVDDAISLIEGLPLTLSLDFNIAPGMHAEIGQYDHRRDLFLTFDELHAPRLDVYGLVSMFSDWIARHDQVWPHIEIFGDATGSSRWAGTGESCYEILEQALRNQGLEYRIRVPRVNPPAVDRYNAMNVAMLDLQGKTHWVCTSRCVYLLNDLRQMKRNQLGEVDKRDKKLSHASDAEGYRVVYLRPARVKVVRRPGRFTV